MQPPLLRLLFHDPLTHSDADITSGGPSLRSSGLRRPDLLRPPRAFFEAITQSLFFAHRRLLLTDGSLQIVKNYSDPCQMKEKEGEGIVCNFSGSPKFMKIAFAAHFSWLPTVRNEIPHNQGWGESASLKVPPLEELELEVPPPRPL